MKKIFFIALSSAALSCAAQQNVEFTKDNFKDRKDGLKEAKKNLEQGDQFFMQGDMLVEDAFKGEPVKFRLAAAEYSQALPFYLKANDFNPNNALLNYKIGVCYVYSNYKLKGKPFIEKAFAMNPNIAPMIHYYLGREYHLNMDWDKAIKEYKTFQMPLNPDKEGGKIRDASKKVTECQNGMELVKKPVRVFIDNVGGSINSSFPDYGPVISADESVMMFTSRRDNTTGGGKDVNDAMFYEDIYISYNKDGKWQPGQNMGKPINTEGHDATVGLSADGQKLFIYIDEKGDGNIFECDQKGNFWAKPDRMNTINSKFHEPSASLSADGKTLYFVSNKDEDNLGGHDIYKSTLDAKGKWTKPVNLGPTINTQYEEQGCFIHPDGKTLYFSSQGHKTMGGYDIFKSVYDAKTGKWSEPENIGYPVNSPDDDIDFVLSASGKHGYYSSFKDGGYGEKDIYIITFISDKKPILNTEDNLLASLANPVKENVMAAKVEVGSSLTLLKGVITDALNGKILEAQIELVDNQMNQVIATFSSNSATGKYLVSLPSGKNYGIAVKKDGYLFHSENFDIPASSGYQEVVKDIALKAIAIGNKIILKNIFFDFDKSTLRPESQTELDRLVKLLNENPTIKIELSGHTDSKGSDEYNLKLSQNRAQAVVDYLTQHGIDKGRLTAMGYGETKPIATNDTDEGRQLNRRTEFEILSK